MAGKQQSLEYKIALLKYLIDTKAWLLDSHVEKFWDFVGDTFAAKAAPQGSPQLTGKELEAICKDEVELWGNETEHAQNKRRKGHEAGSEYDELMHRWVDIWDSMMIEYWKMEIEQPGPNFHNYELIPQIWREGVQKLVSETKTGQSPTSQQPEKNRRTTRSRSMSRPPSKTPQATEEYKQEQEEFSYDTEKLRRVVESAKLRAIEQGKGELGAAVQQIFDDSLSNIVLRRLLEKILTHAANDREHAHFQEYVKLAKRKLKDAKANKEREIKHASPQVQARRRTMFPNMKPAPEKASDVADSASAPATQQTSQKESTSDGKASASQPTPGAENKKRKRESGTLNELKAAAVQRASKQVKLANGEAKASSQAGPSVPNKRNEKVSRQADVSSRTSSPLSSHPETDVEAAKQAYADEVARSKSTNAKDGSDSNSPIVTADGASTAMPLEQQATAGAKQPSSSSQPPTDPVAVSSPRPVPKPIRTTAPETNPETEADELTPADSSHAYRIITGAAAEAVAPALSRLEEKIDAFITSQQSQTQQPTPPPQHLSTPTSNQKIVEASTSTSRELMNIATALQSSDINTQSPEFVQLVSKLAKGAAEASIHAAEAAKKAAEMARDVSMVLMQIGVKPTGAEESEQ